MHAYTAYTVSQKNKHKALLVTFDDNNNDEIDVKDRLHHAQNARVGAYMCVSVVAESTDVVHTTHGSAPACAVWTPSLLSTSLITADKRNLTKPKNIQVIQYLYRIHNRITLCAIFYCRTFNKTGDSASPHVSARSVNCPYVRRSAEIAEP